MHANVLLDLLGCSGVQAPDDDDDDDETVVDPKVSFCRSSTRDVRRLPASTSWRFGCPISRLSCTPQIIGTPLGIKTQNTAHTQSYAAWSPYT